MFVGHYGVSFAVKSVDFRGVRDLTPKAFANFSPAHRAGFGGTSFLRPKP
ncbi:MAG: hypothetical protein QOJ64_285 [Acidobacteriota bacterium]|jgi:hypothetical protein|nr:hypothetical protein [Acidobacteriota bacterium]